MFLGFYRSEQKNEVVINGKVIGYDFMNENKKEGREWWEKNYPNDKLRYIGKSKVTYHDGRKEKSKTFNHFWVIINS